MKKQTFQKMLNLRSFALIAIFSVAVFATSCNEADDGYIPSESEMMLKKGKPMDKPGAPAKGDETIKEIAEDNGFSLLLAAAEYAELTGALTGDDQITVFAPADSAFLNLVSSLPLDPDVLENNGPFAAIDDLLGEGTVKNVLLYHVAEGRCASNSVLPKGNNMKTIETLLDGATFSVSSGGMIYAIGNEATITAADISASNGIIHVIDTVILPIE